MSASVTWQNLIDHSVYPQGAPTRSEARTNGAQVADPNAWRSDRELIGDVAKDLSKLCGSTPERLPKSRQAAISLLQQCQGDADGLAEAVTRLCKTDWFGRWALQVDPYALVGKIVAEYARGMNHEPRAGTVAATLAEMHARGELATDQPFDDEDE